LPKQGLTPEHVSIHLLPLHILVANAATVFSLRRALPTLGAALHRHGQFRALEKLRKCRTGS